MKKKIWIALFLLPALLLAGCGGYIEETGGTPVAPVQEGGAAAASTVMPLYFRFYREGMLLRCPVTVEVLPQKQAEYYAIQALLSGRVSERPEVTPCFSGKTELIEVAGEGNTLFVTLSEDFLNDTRAANEEETLLARRLAVYSIVNTVCEMGTYAYVQLYLLEDGVARRPQANELGIAPTGDTATLGPLSRNTALILTPSGTARAALSRYTEQAWDKLYLYLTDGTGEPLPIAEEFVESMRYRDLHLSDVTVEENYTVSDDGLEAAVIVSMSVKTDSRAWRVQSVPLRLVYKSHGWYIDYASLLSCVEVAS